MSNPQSLLMCQSNTGKEDDPILNINTHTSTHLYLVHVIKCLITERSVIIKDLIGVCYMLYDK